MATPPAVIPLRPLPVMAPPPLLLPPMWKVSASLPLLETLMLTCGLPLGAPAALSMLPLMPLPLIPVAQPLGKQDCGGTPAEDDDDIEAPFFFGDGALADAASSLKICGGVTGSATTGRPLLVPLLPLGATVAPFAKSGPPDCSPL